MNDLIIGVDRLDDLVNLAKVAETGFEKAAVFAAVTCLVGEFERAHKLEQLDSYALEKVTHAAWHIKAIVGYDVTNDKPMDQHVSWAVGSLMTLRDVVQAAN